MWKHLIHHWIIKSGERPHCLGEVWYIPPQLNMALARRRLMADFDQEKRQPEGGTWSHPVFGYLAAFLLPFAAVTAMALLVRGCHAAVSTPVPPFLAGRAPSSRYAWGVLVPGSWAHGQRLDQPHAASTPPGGCGLA